MNYFDLHCDTLFELYRRGLPFDNGETMVNARTASLFENYRQVFAIWSDAKLTPAEQWTRFLETVEYKKRLSLPDGHVLAAEGGSLLDGRHERLKILYDHGVRILTLVWKGICCIGGAYDTDEGLTPFGKSVLEGCASLGILPDLSHASDRMIDETLASGVTPICSHSNSRAVFDHPRNLTDGRFRAVVRRGGIVGLCMAGAHISEKPTFDALIDHLFHFLDLGGEDALCLGCDLDGISYGPAELRDQSDLVRFREAMEKRGIGETLQNKIFFDNASRFFARAGVL